MNFYNKYILPKLINLAMRKKEVDGLRPEVISEAEGLVLEIGFGSGFNLPYYKNISKLYALDPSLELYQLARERIKKVSFPVEYFGVSAEQIPLDTNSIDAVISTWSLCSVPRPEIALQEVFRVLKPGGKFIFIEHGRSPNKYIVSLQNILNWPSKRIAGGCNLNRKMETLIDNSGLKIKKLEKFPLKLRPLYFMYKGVAIKKTNQSL